MVTDVYLSSNYKNGLADLNSYSQEQIKHMKGKGKDDKVIF